MKTQSFSKERIKGLGGPTKKVGFAHEVKSEDKSLKFAKALNKKKKGFSY